MIMFSVQYYRESSKAIIGTTTSIQKFIYLEELIVFKDFSAVIIHWTFGFGQPLGAAQEIPKGSPSSTSMVCGGSSLKLNSSDLRTKTELVMAVPYLFLAKHWYWPKRYETANTGEWIQTERVLQKCKL